MKATVVVKSSRFSGLWNATCKFCEWELNESSKKSAESKAQNHELLHVQDKAEYIADGGSDK